MSQTDVEKKYKWLIKHLIWNGSRETGNNFWVKISPAEAEILKEGREVVGYRSMKGGIKLEVIEMEKNNIVLDTRV